MTKKVKGAIRLVEGYYKANPQGNGLFILKSIGRYKPYAGLYRLVKIESKYHYYQKYGGLKEQPLSEYNHNLMIDQHIRYEKRLGKGHY